MLRLGPLKPYSRATYASSSRSRRCFHAIRSRLQRFCYWLGPTYCVLLGAFILFGSFIIQLLTSIGVPYIKAFDFYRFDFSNFTFVELGMWAACTGREAFIIPTRPDLNQPEEFNCPPAEWGWKSPQFQGITDNFFDKNLPKALIMHPISCCFTFMAMTTALVTMKRQKQHFLLPIFSFLSCLFALASFFIDVGTFVPARHKLMSPRAYSILGMTVISTNYGPAFWLSLSCFVLDIVGNGIIIAGYSIWRYQRISLEQRRTDRVEDVEKKAGSRMSRRGYFANDSTASLSDHSPYTEKNTAAGGSSSKILFDYSDRAGESRATSAMSRNSVGTKLENEIPMHEMGKSAEASHRTSVDGTDVEDVFADADARSQMTGRSVGAAQRRRSGDDAYSDAEHMDDDDEDGYDSAVSAYADARSEAASRNPSRSQVALPRSSSPEQTTVRTQSPTMGNSGFRNVRRKPVERA